MNDSETDSQSIKALIVFRENGETDNLFVPILCDAIRMAGIDVRCSQKEFWESDTTYDIIHFQWPEEVVGWICEDHDVIRRLKERIAFFRSRGANSSLFFSFHLQKALATMRISSRLRNFPKAVTMNASCGRFRY